MKKHVFGRLSYLQEIMFGLGIFVTGMIFVAIVLILVLILKLIGADKIKEKLKDKIMWEPVFRG